MNAWVIVAIVVLVVLAGVAVVAAGRRREAGAAVGQVSRETLRRDRARRAEEAAEADAAEPVASGREIERAAVLARAGGGAEIEPVRTAAPVEWVPPDPETVGVSRRQFLNRGMIAVFGLALAAFGGAVLGFLYPRLGGGFGSKIRVGKVSDVKAEIEAAGGFLYKPEGRMWVTEYPADALEKARAVYSAPELNGMEAGLVALYQKCPHLGCRVPECQTSQWFECPCHGSQYNRAGEKKGGPAPRGMDRFGMEIQGDIFVVDTGQVIQGPPIGTNTTGQEAEGPNCISGGGH